MFKPKLFKWYEFTGNEAQVIWFRHFDGVDAFCVLKERGEWIYDGSGNYGSVSSNPNLWREPKEELPQNVLRELIADLLKNGY